MNKLYLSRVMKIIMFLFIAGFTTVSASSYSQQITLKGKNIPFSTVIDAIRKQSGYTVFGTKKLLESTKSITIDVKNMPLSQFMDKITLDQPIDYAIEDKTISLSGKQAASATVAANPVSAQQQTISGTVRHAETRELLVGVTVRLKGSNINVITGLNGQYKLSVPLSERKQTLVFSYVGMKTQEIAFQKQAKLDVELQPNNEAMDEVVVTGIFQRDRNAFTGSSARYTAKDLQVVGNQGVLQSLKTLDPSFAIIDNNQFGSDPNRPLDIEIRGKSSVIGLTDEFGANPNQPLFILDGFESTLAIISDLSMDRVESITILKDAAASAIYGSKAANGVVVVETKRPTAGSLRVNYTLNSTIGFADLSDYNLMNAEEKLQFEYLSGFYGLLNTNGDFLLPGNPNSQTKYYNRLAEVRRGVNTYWAAEPLRVANTQRHTLFAEGGDASLRYSASMNYGVTKGVMKGSDRQAINGNIRLLYRKGPFSVNNSLSIDNVSADRETSPFSAFSRANPYSRKYAADGSINMILEDLRSYLETPIYSPFYDVSNLNFNKQESQGFTNNTEMEWRLTESLRARGRFGIRNITTQDQKFRSPFNIEFLNTDVLEKGSYNESNGKDLNYDGDFTMTYGKLVAMKHSLNAVGGIRMEQNRTRNSAYLNRGFVDDEFSNPNFSLGYPEGKRADYQESKRRGASFYLNTGYMYDQRYSVDATLRSDGSSVFGSKKHFSSIWSVGLSWSIHKEAFMKDWKSINQFRLRASIGNPATQNFSDYISMRIYRYNNDNRNPFGASTIIDNMGNADLKWQTTLDRNIGLDLTMLDNRLRFNADYFVKSTDPLLVIYTPPSSTGVVRVAKNMGGQVGHGFTLTTDYLLMRGDAINWRVNLNLRRLTAEYRNMGNELSNFNSANKLGKSLIRYYDGGSPSDLWTVRSQGIDPATGREIFLNRNDEQTFVYNFEDEVVVGNAEPKVEGVFGTNLFYKGFTVSMNVRYRIGGQAFMKTLFDKVENIDIKGVFLNQDRRALTERWKQPGDNARFKSISTTEITPISSRFVSDNSSLIGEAFSLGYENSTANWLKSVRASSITIRAYMNDIFYISTIKNERGLDYPFARSVSFSAAVRF